MKVIKVKKKFQYEGIELRIVAREEPYLNSPDPVVMTRVIAPNDGIIPVRINRNQSMKSIQEATIELLDSFAERGADIKEELTRIL